jgi:CIC family chloride channel protein
MRILVGAGAGAAIGAAFGAPLAGAFYAFEIVIGSYTPSAIAPVAAASLAGVWAADALGGARYAIQIHAVRTPDILGYLLYGGLGLICALAGVAIMRLVGGTDRLVRASPIPPFIRPAIGGVLVGALALVSPQVLSAGHGALHLDLAVGAPLAILGAVFLVKVAASTVSLGFGFRGGLFFASLFLGTLLGQLYAGLIDFTAIPQKLSPENAALVGMGALAVSIVGGPLTMSFLVLETTQDFGVTAATLAAALIASSVVRERFGYSFSTWRLHLRGETIRSARDVGWIRTLTAGRMMRSDVKTLAASASVAEFRRRFPLGSTQRVILLDDEGRYDGLVVTASAYGEDVETDGPVTGLAVSMDVTLSPDLNIVDVMHLFETTETDELAVVDETGKVLGLLAEAYVTRRYASELERQHLDLYGEARD